MIDIIVRLVIAGAVFVVISLIIYDGRDRHPERWGWHHRLTDIFLSIGLGAIVLAVILYLIEL